MKNIDSAFRHIKYFSMLLIAGCILITCFALYKSFKLVEEMQTKIYILAGGKALEAFASNGKDNLLVESRDHIKTFHELFFTLDPDDQVIQQNISKSLYLADASAKKEYDNLKEKGYYAGIISGNISQAIQVDSIKLDTSHYPYAFECFATQFIIRTTSKTSRSLISKGLLRDISRSDHNPHGFLIERWEIVSNQDIKTEWR